MKSRVQRSLQTIGMAMLLACQAHGQDRIFTYTYQSTTLPPGKAELEVWNTVRWERSDFYRGFDHRIEFELGVASRLQTSFYLNVSTEAFKTLTDSYSTDPGGHLIITPTPSIQSDVSLSFSNEWKYKLADPVADKIGLALYGELTIGQQSSEVEAKIILDKGFGPLFSAFNLVGDLETETILDHAGARASDKEYEVEIDYGLTCAVGGGFHTGIEVVNMNALTSQEWEHSALFLGPTLSYTADNFWVNLTVLPQVKGLRGSTADGLVLDERERLHTRLLFSYGL